MSASSERYQLDVDGQIARIEKTLEESSKLRMEQNYIPKDYTLRVATVTAAVAAALSSGLTILLLHR